MKMRPQAAKAAAQQLPQQQDQYAHCAAALALKGKSRPKHMQTWDIEKEFTMHGEEHLIKFKTRGD